MNVRKSDTVGSIVTRNIQAAEIFNDYNIDFCFHGDQTLEAACVEANVSIVNIIEELWELEPMNKTLPDFGGMRMDALTTYIVSTHHKYTEKQLVFIKNNIERLMREHVGSDPALTSIQKAFDELSVHLTIHMKQEEFIVFPYIRKMVKKGSTTSSMFQSVENPISNMIDDHNNEGKSLRRLDDLTHHYKVPSNGDYIYKVTYSAMKELEEDLRIHMHLENNILFPKAIHFEMALRNN